MAFLDGPDTYTVGDVGVPAAVAPLGTFPSYRSSCGIGTPKLVDTLVARDAIPSNYRAEGMFAFVSATGLTYQLVGGITNLDWVPFAGGASALAAVLLVGNTTGGTDIELTSGDEVRGVDAAAGGPVVVRGGTGSATTGASASLLGGGAASGFAPGAAIVRGADAVGAVTGATATLTGGNADGSALSDGGAAGVTGGSKPSGVGAGTGGLGFVRGGSGNSAGQAAGGAEVSAGDGLNGATPGDALVRGGDTAGAGAVAAGGTRVRGGNSSAAGIAGGALDLDGGLPGAGGVAAPVRLNTAGITRWTVQDGGELAGSSGAKLDADGAVGLGKVRSIAFVDSPYSVVAEDTTILVDASGGPVTVDLPALATELRREIRVKKTDASLNAVTIDGDGAETIDGAATLALATQYESATLIAGSATDWSQFGASATPPVGVWGTNDFTNGNGGAITEGQAVFVTTGGARRVDLADATADAAAARVIGFVVPASIASLAVGSIRTDGLATARLVAGLALTLGDEVFLSTTPGSCTNDISGYVPGNVAKTVGYLTDALTYDGAGDLLVQLQVERGPKAVL